VLLALQNATFSIIVGGIPANMLFLALATTVEMKVFSRASHSDPDSPPGLDTLLL
jgi:hypothetical protein